MANESTPLITTVVVAPPRRRYTHQTFRRFCTLACSVILIAGFVTFAVNALVLWPRHHHLPGEHHGHHSATSLSSGQKFTKEDLEKLLLDTPSPELAEEWSRYYTDGPHLAGRNFSQADWTRERWESWGLRSEIIAYDTYINYPKDHGLALLKKHKDSESYHVDFKASLKEDVLKEDPTTSRDDRVPTFHGYSASGNVTASFVYVNYGMYQDFEDLVKAGIDLKGKIALARYGGIFRGLKVKRAQELGMIGTVIFTDPGDDGEVTAENGYKEYPDGPARNPSSVQRGSVQFLSVRPGDPTTPGYPSKPGVPRMPANESTPEIPSLPISYEDALPILKALNGVGPKAKDFSSAWTRNLGLKHKGVDYNIGPSPEHIVLNLYNEQEYVTTPLWDVIGVVNGTIPNEVVVIGNHRDAWLLGGAGDPNSGSAVINEVIRGVGIALEAGWKPLRTIVFASWDGEEYGLIGSTEWVEEYLPWISDANVAYVNVDVGCSGPVFTAAAAPLLNQVLRSATSRVLSPNQTVEGQTISDVWDGHIRTMGSGSDFTAFQDFAGVPSLDMGFKADESTSVYHYHSNYDSFYWMKNIGDPGFLYHKAMAQVLGLVLVDLVENIILPFGAAEYANALVDYLSSVEKKLDPKADAEIDILEARAVVKSDVILGSKDDFRHSLSKIRHALAKLQIKARDTDSLARWVNKQLDEGVPWWNVVKRIKVARAIAKVMKQYKYLERYFLYEGGLDGREWFKHVVFAPGLWTGYAGAVFPGLVESIDAKDYVNGMKWAGIIRKCVEDAVKSLE